MVNSNGISFSGLASGLDTRSIINQLVALERIPIRLIESKREGAQKRLDRIGTLEELVKSLQSAAETLSSGSNFFAFTVNNTDESVATITASGTALPGSHTLDVTRVASTDRWAFDAVADPDLDLASADGEQITFDVGTTSYSLVVNQSNSSLNNLAAAINTMAGDDVTASVVNTGTESNPQYRLVLASDESGEDLRITNIATDIAGLSIAYSPPDGNGDATSASNITVGNNALVVIDGLAVERASNDLSDVFEGIQIQLLSATGGTPITFSVDPDREAIRGNLDSFVSAYNAVIDFVNKESTFTPSEDEDDPVGTSGVLFGDSLLTSVTRNIRRALFDIDLNDILNDTAGFSTLSLIGITTTNDGKLEIDDTVLDAKMSEDLELFADLFVDSDGFDNGGAPPNTPGFYEDQTADSGLAALLVREIDRMFGSFEGPVDPLTGEPMQLDALFDLKEDTLRADIDGFNDQIESMERRLDAFERNLVLRFARLEELMSSLNAQGATLAFALQNLS